MKSRKLLIMSVALLFQVVTKAQLDFNRNYVKLIAKSEKLSEAIGWTKNPETKRWIDNENYISDVKGERGEFQYGFNSIQILKIKHKDSLLFIFLIENTIHQEVGLFSSEPGKINSKIFYFLKETDYRQLKSLLSIDTSFCQRLYLRGSINDEKKNLDGKIILDEEHLLAEITSILDENFEVLIRPKENRKNMDVRTFHNDMPIKVKLSKEESWIRFLLPYSKRDLNSERCILDKYYFEIPPEEFVKMFIE